MSAGLDEYKLSVQRHGFVGFVHGSDTDKYKAKLSAWAPGSLRQLKASCFISYQPRAAGPSTITHDGCSQQIWLWNWRAPAPPSQYANLKAYDPRSILSFRKLQISAVKGKMSYCFVLQLHPYRRAVRKCRPYPNNWEIWLTAQECIFWACLKAKKYPSWNFGLPFIMQHITWLCF